MPAGTQRASGPAPLRPVGAAFCVSWRGVVLTLCACLAAPAAWTESLSGSRWDIQTFAGSVPAPGGRAVDAFLSNPSGIALDAKGNVLVSDRGPGALWVRRVTPDGGISVLAGTGEPGGSGEGVSATNAPMQSPGSVAVDPRDDSVYVADSNQVRKIDSRGIVTTVAGSGQRGRESTQPDGIEATAFHLGDVVAIDLDPGTASLYVATGEGRIWRVVDNRIFHFAGTSHSARLSLNGLAGPRTAALGHISDIEVAPDGSLLMAETLMARSAGLRRARILRVTSDGSSMQVLIAPTALAPRRFDKVSALALDVSGRLHFADPNGALYRIADDERHIEWVADLGVTTDGGDGLVGMEFGRDGKLVFAESSAACRCVREWNPSGGFRMIAGGSNLRGDGVPSLQARFHAPSAIAFDLSGNLVVSDDGNGVLRSIAPTRRVSSLDAGFFADGVMIAPDRIGGMLYGPRDAIRRLSGSAPAGSAPVLAEEQLQGVRVGAIASDPFGRIHLVSEQSRLEVLKLNPDGSLGVVAGTRTPGDSGDGGPAVEARFQRIDDIAFDDAGHLYIADAFACRIRKVDAVDGTVSTVAGNGQCRFAQGRGYPGEALRTPNRIAIRPGPRPELFVSSLEDNLIQRVFMPAELAFVEGLGKGARVETVAGTGEPGFSGDGGDARRAQLWHPGGMAFGPDARLYVADQGNHRIRVLSPTEEQFRANSATGFGEAGGWDAGPDLVVYSRAAEDRILSPGQIFTLQSTVRNQGIRSSLATTLRYYRSVSRTVSVDTPLGIDPVGGLSVSGTTDVSIRLAAPRTPGEYSYSTCVAAVSGEVNLGNNCSDPLTITVRRVESLPCSVSLERSNEAGGTETVSITASDLTDIHPGTVDEPSQFDARMDTPSDYDAYRVVLRGAGNLSILSTSSLDMQVVAVDESCESVDATVIEDLGVIPDVPASNLNFGFVATIAAGTYYFAVYEWAGRVGDYALHMQFESESEVVVNHRPEIESVQDQEIGVGSSATVGINVADEDSDDIHTLLAESSDPSVATAELTGTGRSRRLAVSGHATGTAIVTIHAIDSSGRENALAERVEFSVSVTDPSLEAPNVESGAEDTSLHVSFVGSFGAGGIRAYDIQVRRAFPQDAWRGGCNRFRNSSGSAGTERIQARIGGLMPGLGYQLRYRDRNSDSCLDGLPSEWSQIGEGATSGTAANRAPVFLDGVAATRSVNENTPGGINVGSPVRALDLDDDGHVLFYNLSGTDADSFAIVPATGQIRTRSDVILDYESRQSYSVTVQVSDIHGATDSISVEIRVNDLGTATDAPSNVRTNDGDREVTIRWDPAPDPGPASPVLGYDVEIRTGSTGPWTICGSVGGRRTTSMLCKNLTNDAPYQVRVRTRNPEGPSTWSDPVPSTPTTDKAPRDGPEFFDRLRGGRLGPWRFPVAGRCTQTVGGHNLDANCSYSKTGPETGQITLEYDEIGRESLDISLLFSSLTQGAFLREHRGAGVNPNVGEQWEAFDILNPPADSADPVDNQGPLAPQDAANFDEMVFGNNNLIAGVTFGQLLPRAVFAPGVSFPNQSGVFHRTVRSGGQYQSFLGDYTYYPTGPNNGVLTLLHRDESLGEWVYELEFIAPGVAKFTLSVNREGQLSITQEGFIDFESNDHIDDSGIPILDSTEIPPVLLPPAAPPQETGKDLSGVEAAASTTPPSISSDSFQAIFVQNSGLQNIAYQPGNWLEPKDGSNQRMMIVGGGPAGGGTPADGSSPFGRKADNEFELPGLRRADQSSAGAFALSVVCMQIQKRIPFRGSRFFSRPKSPQGAVETCQRDCVLGEDSEVQGCVWECERESRSNTVPAGSPLLSSGESGIAKGVTQ